jgi:hypothetical protein
VVAVTLTLTLTAAPGCQGSAQRRIASAEPGLVGPIEPGAKAAEAPGAVVASPTGSWADRHPLFTRPREYYETTPSNKVVKAAAATVIGIPAGLFGELKQIVVGTPPETRY